MKSFNKPAAIAATVILTIALSACSHENPLKTQDNDVNGRFLAMASKTAAKQIGQPTAGEDLYGHCMDNDGTYSTTICNKLYQAMVDYAKTKPGYAKLTIKDLTDKNLWQQTEPQYKRRAFESLPD